jgi:hypothetical protein
MEATDGYAQLRTHLVEQIVSKLAKTPPAAKVPPRAVRIVNPVKDAPR